MRVSGLMFLALLAVGCDATEEVTPAPQDPPNVVDAVGVTAWSPATITIRIGESVAFRNSSITIHNVQFTDEVAGRPADVANFGSGIRQVPFTVQGSYPYRCGIHPVMQGLVLVVP